MGNLGKYEPLFKTEEKKVICKSKCQYKECRHIATHACLGLFFFLWFMSVFVVMCICFAGWGEQDGMGIYNL